MWLFDQTKEVIKSLFTSRNEVKQPPHSELSSPLTNFRKRNPGKRKVTQIHREILSELAVHGNVASQRFVQTSSIPSSDRRLNDCYHLGLANVEKKLLPGVGKRFFYSISEEGLKLIK